MKAKRKPYKKPRIVKVKLAIQNPILGNCSFQGSGAAGDPFCTTSIGCPFP